MRNTILVAALALGALCGTAQAKDIYVSKTTGSNKGPGTKEAPFKLLWKVMGKLEAGTTIHVAEGVYNGRKKSGCMPKIEVGNVSIIGGYKADWSERDPFKYLSIITGDPKKPGDTKEVFLVSTPKNDAHGITLDGFCLDRGAGCIYVGHGEGGTSKYEGHQDSTPWGYQGINKKKSGSDPCIELLGKGSFTVRNMIMINNPWWGISIKAGGDGEVIIENNLILGYQGRGIEAIAGGGWGKPKFIIRNNTVACGDAMEGRALSLDPRKGYSTSYTVENNVLAFGMQTGIMTKFGMETLTFNNNLFYGFTKGDAGDGGSGICNADEFEDEIECDNEGNVHECPNFPSKIEKAWFDRWSQWKGMQNDIFTDDEIMAARKKAGLGVWELAFFPGKTYEAYSKLPSGRIGVHLSRYPKPFKKGEALMDWHKSVIPMIGSDGERGIQAFKAAK